MTTLRSTADAGAVIRLYTVLIETQKRGFPRALAIFSDGRAVCCIDIPIFANRKTCGKYTTEGIIPHCYIYIVPIVLLAGSNFKIGGTPVDTANIL